MGDNLFAVTLIRVGQLIKKSKFACEMTPFFAVAVAAPVAFLP